MAIVRSSRPGFRALFGGFLQLPDLGVVRRQIFEAAHHVDYNTSGQPYFSVVGTDLDHDYGADVPVLCAMLDPNGRAQSSFVQGATRIGCEIARGAWPSGAQSPTDPAFKSYTGWFALAQRGGGGPGSDVYYALVDTYTGRELSVQGQAFRLRDVSPLPEASRLDASGTPLSLDGSTLYDWNQPFCYTYTDASGHYQTSCYQQQFKYVAMALPNLNDPVASADPNTSVDPNASFYAPTTYQPFSTTIPVTQVNGSTGASYSYSVQIAMTGGNPNHTFDPNAAYSICLPLGSVSVVPSDASVVETVDLQSAPVNCANLSQRTGFYYLTLSWAGATTPGTYDYGLLRNDGLRMRNSPSCTGGPGCDPSLPLVALESALGASLGPAAAASYAYAFNLVNPRYNAKYDPYCIDLDGSGHCDCRRDASGDGSFDPNVLLDANSTPSELACNLADRVGHEPTVAQLPVFDSSDIASFLRVSRRCGGKSGTDLQTCVTAAAADGEDIQSMSVDWRSAVFCEGSSTRPTYVDVASIKTNPAAAGAGCGASNTPGPVTLLTFAPRQNAYDLAKPQTALKLIST
ncbi:MAG TPA: hypothetical protein VFH51_19235, partial [Myxococcota bacterium]|nr:hypothetical protein [Myxococcota bacterium]